jgi:P pilus assembly chaperone PapD
MDGRRRDGTENELHRMDDMKTSTETTPPSGQTDSRWGFWLLLVIFLTFATNLCAGVLVAPTVIFISDKNRTGRVDVQNPTQQPREVTIHFAYGLPESDTLGNVTVQLKDSGVVDSRAAVEWVKAFPRKLVIPPGGTQVVRIVATPPPGLADGEYWARIVVRSQEGVMADTATLASGQISTKLNMIMQTAIMLKYRKGNLAAKLEMPRVKATKNDSMVVVMTDFNNLGNASYVGMLNVRVLDADKKEITKQQSDLAVYRGLRRRMELPLKNGIGKLPLQVEISVTTDGRTDIAPEDLIRGNKIQELVTVE